LFLHKLAKLFKFFFFGHAVLDLSKYN
jgi:hypothetical protein